jgi:hypothetical protein
MLFSAISVIINNSRMIIAVTISTLIVCTIYTYGFLPSLYKCHVMFEPGKTGLNYQEKLSFIPSNDIVKKINDGDYNYKIYQKLGGVVKGIDFLSSQQKKSNIIRVSFYHQNLDAGKPIMKALLDAVSDDIRGVMDVWRAMSTIRIKSLEKSIFELENQQKGLEINIGELERQYKKLGERRRGNDTHDGTMVMESNPVDPGTANKILYNMAIQQTLTSRAELLMITNNLMDKIKIVESLRKQLELAKEIDVIGQINENDFSDKPNRLAIITAFTLLAFVCSFLFAIIKEAQANISSDSRLMD